HLPPERLVGKLVITGPCENYAIQLISGNIDSSKIMALWRNGDSTYTNVFSVSNRCTFARYGLKRGDKFSFLLNDSLDVQTCMQCEIYIALPPVWNTVTGVQPIP
ncbi:MAG TPA: hypothetical protein VG605_14510, partial [Puia sp.]|nr:hypothetical protein [Puia sp.]